MKKRSSFLHKNALLLTGVFFSCSALLALGAVILFFTRGPEVANASPSFAAPTDTITLPAPQIMITVSTDTPVFIPILVTPTASPLPTPAEGEPFPIGYSVEGRPLDVYQFGHGPNARMIVGAIHGGYEDNTARLVSELIADLQNGQIVVPADVTLYLLPVLNPDGYAKFPGQPEGRPNTNGVDLNRNFDIKWEPDWDRTGCFSAVPINAGPSPFSEPETEALSKFILSRPDHIQALISYHSAMAVIYAGGQPKDKLSDNLARALDTASPYGYPPKDEGCQYTGQLIDWASYHGIAAVDIELKNHQATDLDINRDILRAFLAWMPGE